LLNTHCYADSASQRDFLIENGIVRPEKIGVIGVGSIAGVDLGRFTRERFSPEQRRKIRAELGISERSKLVLFIGRICAEKGIAELLEAFQRVLDAGIDSDLLLVGPIDLAARDTVAMSASTLADHKRVHHVGYTDSPESYYAIADLLCLPSYREGFGTVVIEAASMGVPALGTDIYGLRDAIADGLSGVLVPPKDAVALAEALATLLKSSQTLEKMGKAARARSEALFDARIVSEKLIDEYQRLLKKPMADRALDRTHRST
jgi:glycosyltransferase involved in cell wall biosynthesis